MYVNVNLLKNMNLKVIKKAFFHSGAEFPLNVDLEFQTDPTVKTEPCQIESPEREECFDRLKLQEISNDRNIDIKLEDLESSDYGADISETRVKSEYDDTKHENQGLIIKEEEEDEIDM